MTPYGQGSWNSIVGTFEPDDPKCYCDRCGKEVDGEDDLHEVCLDEFVCDECYDEYVKCEGCDTEINIDDSFEVEGKNYCEDCHNDFVRVCAICGVEYYNEDEDVLICAKCSKEIV